VAEYTIAELADYINGEVKGDAQHVISNVATLANATSAELSFLANPKYRKYLSTTHAGCVLVNHDAAQLVIGNAIITDDPYVAYAKLATLLYPEPELESAIAASAVVAENVRLGARVHIAANVVIEQGVSIADDVSIGPGCYVGADVKIGSACRLKANVTLQEHVTLGDRVIVHSGVVIGSDGFGIANEQGVWIKIPQVGSVRIGDDVEIGANTTIDRGAIEDTVISNGCKLDNQIQIGHNVTIGEHSVIAGCVGIAGSTSIGAHCAIGGGTGITGHITITDGVQLMGMSMVTKSISEPGVYAAGIPVEPLKKWHKNVAYYRRASELVERVKKLENG
jgi:UDP-3-O-[3-hydroxymyristoyl] glucosamine N-acyltransferase